MPNNVDYTKGFNQDPLRFNINPDAAANPYGIQQNPYLFEQSGNELLKKSAMNYLRNLVSGR